MRGPRPFRRLIDRWRTLPPRTIRVRLTVIYAGLFLACGAGLLAINFVLVSARLTSDYFEQISVKAGNQQIIIERRGGPSSGGLASPAPGGGSGGTISGSTRKGGPTLITGAGIPKGVRLPSKAVSQASAAASANAAQGALLIESGVALAIMALLASGLGWVIAGRALRPLRAITAAAREISASNLHRRLALAGPNDELRQLGRTFDALLERLETSFTAQRQFAANVSHELRTPLTYERALIEVALADPTASSERLRAVLDQVLAAGEHQERLIEALLVLSRGQRGLDHRERLDLAAVATQTLDHVDTSALTLECSLAPAPVDGDPRLIERLVANLVTNAVQHNEPGGRIYVATAITNDSTILRVTNSGPTIPPDDRSRLFEPFQRIDGSRTSTADGLGLGLSIVQAIADAHSAAITTTLPDHGGLAIEIAFPAPEPSRHAPAVIV
jgi:signal transduction histidine kinase